MIPFEYVVIIFALCLLVVSIIIKEWVIGMISGFLLMIIGIYVIINGVVDLKDWFTQSFGIIIITIGMYVIGRGGIELLQNTIDEN